MLAAREVLEWVAAGNGRHDLHRGPAAPSRGRRQGFLATMPEEWVERIRILVRDPDLRRKMSMRGRTLVENDYSLRATLTRFARVLEEARR